MRRRFATLLLLTLMSACSGQSGQHYSVFFQPYSASLDPQAQQAVDEAATFAKAHTLMPISIKAYTPYMGEEIDTMSGQRTETVLRALLQRGISRMRIEVVGSDRLLDPNGMPNLPRQRVDIYVGF
jgi:outer membrane protein OmpA-like peptidoglycan-associated protein